MPENEPSPPASPSAAPTMPDGLRAHSELNPKHKIRYDGTYWFIENPWEDETVGIRIKESDTDIFEIVRTLRFPQRFSAIHHTNSNDWEFIYGYLAPDNAAIGRTFQFVYKEGIYSCEFSTASEELLKVCSISWQLGPPTATKNRNVIAIRYERDKKSKKPISFWIRNAPVNDEFMALLARHINFYSNAYDRDTPIILIHDKKSEDSLAELTLFPHGGFPEHITAHEIRPYLLSLWESARFGSVFQRYLRYYQIIEHAAFYYVQEDVLQDLRIILLNPHLLTDVSSASEKIFETLVPVQHDDTPRQNDIIERFANTTILWNDIQARKDFFTTETTFEGGLKIPALISDKDTPADFIRNCHPKIANSLRKIRNAIVHAREHREITPIHPTQKNEANLRPWLDLLRSVAIEILIYNRKV
jgi:hypothetical protein